LSAKPPVVHSDPEILGGTPVFVGTRVPFQALLDYREHDVPILRPSETTVNASDVAAETPVYS
jgi:uncharacterized protein DUF433